MLTKRITYFELEDMESRTIKLLKQETKDYIQDNIIFLILLIINNNFF